MTGAPEPDRPPAAATVPAGPESAAAEPAPRESSAARLAVAATLSAFAAVAGLLPVHSVDAFWHLAAGRWMLAHHELLRTDPFRFSSGDVPWVDHEWGFQLLLALAERLGGVPALVAGRAALLAVLALLLLAGLRRRGLGTPAAAVIVMVAVLGIRTRLPLRPELATLLAIAALLLLLERLRRGDGAGTGSGAGIGTGAAILVLVVVWANLHPGVLAAPLVAAAYLGGTWAGRLRTGEPGAGAAELQPPPWLALALPPAMAAAILVNPWGPALYRVPGEIAAALSGLPAENPDWQPLWRARPLGLGLALAATLALLVLARRRGGRIDAGLGLTLAALLALAATGARHKGLAWVGWALFTGATLASIPRASIPRAARPRVPAPLAVAACLGAAAWCLLPPTWGAAAPGRRAGLGIEPRRFPAGAVAALERWEPVGHLYNSAPFGGYLLWRLYPPRQVFLDTRNEVDPGLLRELAEARTGAAAWNALLDRYDIDGAVVRYEQRTRPTLAPGPPGAPPRVEHHTSSALLFPPDRFALVHWDDVSMLFLARRPDRERRLAAAEYRYVQPEDWRATLERAAADPDFARGLAAEVARKLAEEPGCRRARAFEEALRRIAAAR